MGMRYGDQAFGSLLAGIMGTAGVAFLILSASLLLLLEKDQHLPEKAFFIPEHSTQAEWPFPFIHIVNSRFMQNQGNLTGLARARLILFENFCVASMTHQSLLRFGQHPAPFLWIIKVDPALNHDILQELLLLVKDYPFIYVVGSNVNYGIGIHPGGWRGGQAGSDVLGSTIYSGDLDWLRIAHSARREKAVLETRLDADDGLHVAYLAVIQSEAAKRLRLTHNDTNASHQEWMYWCPMNRLDWNPSPPRSNATKYGIFLARKSSKSCITPGITLGVSVGVEEMSIPRFAHQSLYEQLRSNKAYRPSCGSRKCLDLLTEPILGAIRSRTPTSAGMRGVVAEEADFTAHLVHDVGKDPAIWELLDKEFHVTHESTVKANQYLQTHFVQVVENNLSGQCTPGHSCKNSTKEALQKLLLGKQQTRRY
jgi:hypothetical protein